MVDKPQDQAPLTTGDKMRMAESQLDKVWGRSFSVLARHSPDAPVKCYDIRANIEGSPELQKEIYAMAADYRTEMMKKARVKFDAAELERKQPGRLKRFFSREAKGRYEELQHEQEPLDREFHDLQVGLCRKNVANLVRLRELVRDSYDPATRAELGEGLEAQVNKDAYLILGNTIRIVVENFNEAFRRMGIDEFGIPKNVDDPREMKR